MADVLDITDDFPGRKKCIGPSRLLTQFILFSIVIVIVWPSYFVVGTGFLNVSAPRVLLLFWGGVYSLCFFRFNLLKLPKLKQSSIATIFYGLLFANVSWQFICDVLGDTPKASIILTILETVVGKSVIILPLLLCWDFRGRKRVVIAVLTACIAFLSLGLIEMAAGFNLGSFLRPFSNLDKNLMADISEDVTRNGQTRIKSTFSHPIVLAQTTALLTPLWFVVATSWPKLRIRAVAGLAFLVSPIVIYATHSRSGYIVLLVAFAGYLLLNTISQRTKLGNKVFAAIVLACSAFALSAVYLDDLVELTRGRGSAEAHSSMARDEMLKRGIAFAAESPIIGYGHGRSAHYAGLVGRNKTLTIDNYYLSYLLDFGYVGLALLVCLYSTLLMAGFRAVSRARSGLDRKLCVAMVAAAAAQMVGLFVISSWDCTTFIFITAGFLLPVGRLIERHEQP